MTGSAPQWFLNGLRLAVSAASRVVWRISVRGLEHMPAVGGVVIAPNHQTYFDPFWVGSCIRRPVRYLAWDEAFKWPVMGKALELLGAWPLSYEGGNPTAYRRSRQWLQGGGALMIFPEGQRVYADGEMSQFKVGAVRLALAASVPILPVTISGGERIWPRDQSLPRTGRVEIVFHPTRLPERQAGEDIRECARRETDALAATIKSVHWKGEKK